MVSDDVPSRTAHDSAAGKDGPRPPQSTASDRMMRGPVAPDREPAVYAVRARCKMH